MWISKRESEEEKWWLTRQEDLDGEEEVIDISWCVVQLMIMSRHHQDPQDLQLSILGHCVHRKGLRKAAPLRHVAPSESMGS